MILAFTPVLTSAATNDTNSTFRRLKEEDSGSRINGFLYAANSYVSELRNEFVQDDHRRLEEEEDVPAVFATPDNFDLDYLLNFVASRQRILSQGVRELTHTVPQLVVPRGCEYSFDHDTAANVYVDEIYCPTQCGSRGGATFKVTSEDCDENFRNCGNVNADCFVDECDSERCVNPGDCPCVSINLETACDDYCEEETEPPTLPPTVAPTAAPTEAPTPSPTVASTPSPTTPEPTESPVAVPVDLPETNEPTESPVETPVEQPVETPVVALTNAPTVSPVIGPAEVPVDTTTASPIGVPSDTPSTAPFEDETAEPTPPAPRQSVFVKRTTFRNNRQGNDAAGRGVVIVNSEFNDVLLDFVAFEGNVYSDPPVRASSLVIDDFSPLFNTAGTCNSRCRWKYRRDHQQQLC